MTRSGGLVLVTGPPASGKSTVAAALAPALGLPLFSKDTLEDALVASLGAADVEESRRLGRAAVAALVALVRDLGGPGAVLDSVWLDRDAARAALGDVGVRAEVHCTAALEVLRRRYAARAATRAPGGFDLDRTDDELWAEDLLRPLAGGWPVVRLDTTRPLDLPALLARVPDSAHPTP